MASFPGSAKSFTTKNTGDVVAAAHINDLQDEVNAIEDGLLTGSARLNSSNSTLATLSVSGGSTFAGSLTISSNSTFALRPTMPPPHMALVFAESTGTIGSSALSTLAFQGQAILTNSSLHSTGTNPERLTPQTTGVYQVSAQMTLSTPSVGTSPQLSIMDSSNATLGLVRHPLSTSPAGINVTAYKRFDVVGGYVTCRLAGDGNSTLSLSTGSGLTWFSMVKL